MRRATKTVYLLMTLLLLFNIVPNINAQVVDSEQEDDAICLYLFYSTACPHCDQVESYLERVDSNYSLNISKFEAPRHAQLMQNLSESYGVPQNRRGRVPTGFIGEDYCIGADQCISLFRNKFEQYQGQGLACPLSQQDSSQSRPLTAISLGALALLDAVNPCAIAVLLILLTAILTKYPKRKNKALLAGALFSGAILISYFAIGALIIFGFKSASSAASFSQSWLYKALGVIAIIIGVFNLKDWFKLGAGGFVMEVPFSWRPKMKQIINSITSPAGAFLIGLIVSFFLLPCTSGPYFVASGLLSRIGWQVALPWLFYYNLIFIAPMVLITLGIYAGFASVEKISSWREQNINRLHLFSGLILIALGLSLVLGIL